MSQLAAGNPSLPAGSLHKPTKSRMLFTHTTKNSPRLYGSLPNTGGCSIWPDMKQPQEPTSCFFVESHQRCTTFHAHLCFLHKCNQYSYKRAQRALVSKISMGKLCKPQSTLHPCPGTHGSQYSIGAPSLKEVAMLQQKNSTQ